MSLLLTATCYWNKCRKDFRVTGQSLSEVCIQLSANSNIVNCSYGVTGTALTLFFHYCSCRLTTSLCSALIVAVSPPLCYDPPSTFIRTIIVLQFITLNITIFQTISYFLQHILNAEVEVPKLSSTYLFVAPYTCRTVRLRRFSHAPTSVSSCDFISAGNSYTLESGLKDKDQLLHLKPCLGSTF